VGKYARRADYDYDYEYSQDVPVKRNSRHPFLRSSIVAGGFARLRNIFPTSSHPDQLIIPTAVNHEYTVVLESPSLASALSSSEPSIHLVVSRNSSP
jgi:hypothetical protein